MTSTNDTAAIQPTILVIVGISGDLSKRKLLPAIESIAARGALPEHFRIVGITRRDITLDEVLPAGEGDQSFLREHLELFKMDLTDPAAYQGLGSRLQQIEQEFGAPAQQLFYLSIPPQAAQPVIKLLGASHLNGEHTKLLLEKPFGVDLASAQELITSIQEHFSEQQVYRIDHYLAKEMTQNIMVFRSANTLFRRTWNNSFIQAIEIIASEQIGIEGRGTFYEQTGALRDFVQSHLLQLAALTLCELPPDNDWRSVPEQRLQALRQLLPPADVQADVIRGQYKGYRHEANCDDSSVETFVSLVLRSADPRWKDVPITITTGKALDKKITEIRLTYLSENAAEPNILFLRIQPNESVELCLWAKKPGYDYEMQRIPVDFSYAGHPEKLPEAYERVCIDAMRSDHTLFTTGEEVLASWRILEPILQAWAMSSSDVVLYEPGAAPESIKPAP